MKIRPATEADAVRCAAVSHIRSAEDLRGLLHNSDTQWLVLENDIAEVVGIGILHLWPWNKVVWVWDLTVEATERSKGYGTALLKGMIQAAREMGGRVLMDFGTAKPCELCDLYAKCGFRICGTNDRWFAGDKDSTAVFYGYDL